MRESFRIFTWNMQRRRSYIRSSTTNPATAVAVKNALTALCDKHDFGFVTEPGKDLRTLIAPGNQSSPLPGHWYQSMAQDNQNEASACRPLLYAKSHTLVPFDLPFKSGSDHAHRFPAAAKLAWNGYKILLVAMHATSGGGAKNMQDLLDLFDDSPEKKSKQFSAWLIGGDLNAKEASHSPLRMPAEPTHQTGSTLDGFFTDRFDGTPVVTNLSNISTNIPDVPGFQLITINTQTQLRGCYFNNTKVSDHRPVTAEFVLDDRKRMQDDVDDGDAPPKAKRAKR